MVFSSGSSGQPKAIVLSQRAILANIRSIEQHYDMIPGTDALASPLPLFHSFGLTVGCWWPLTSGLTTLTQRDPRDGRQLNKLCLQQPPALLLGTPTFLRSWLRRLDDDSLAKLKCAVVGAEACPESLRQQFEQRCGVPLLSGYGATELGPFVSCGQPDCHRDGVHEVGFKPGSVGRPAAGVYIETVDPDSGEVLPAGSEGMMVMYSPACFNQYIGDPDRTSAALLIDPAAPEERGYRSGDVGLVDEDGFVHITGRLSRFAKIGGEMVPLDTVQAAIKEQLLALDLPDESRNNQKPNQEQAPLDVVVISQPDEQKGERLICCGTCSPEVMKQAILDASLPPLFQPKVMHQVESIPMLASGKTDLQGLDRLLN